VCGRAVRPVLELILHGGSRVPPCKLVSGNVRPAVAVADSSEVHRLGQRVGGIDPKEHPMSAAVAYMTGAKTPEQVH